MKIFMQFIVTMFLAVGVVSAQNIQNECGPVFDGSIVMLAFECLNDSSAMIIDSSKEEAGWQYSHDSDKDGVTFNRVGGEEFEMYGIAFKETADELLFVINGNLPLAGFSSSGANDGNIGWGDLFIDLDPGTSYLETSDKKSLYGIRFSATNDSDADSIGVYGSVGAKSVASVNQGFKHFGHYKNYVQSKGSLAVLGDLGSDQDYYADKANQNVIETFVKLGEISFLTPLDLDDLGYDYTKLEGIVSIAFKFKKYLIIDACGVPGGDGSSCADCAGVFCGTSALDQCNVCGGDGTSCLDCAGTPFGGLQLDQCGVCGGDGTSCLDCEGVPFGSKQVDQCDVCGGDGSSCLDCADTPFGDLVVDQCGVCGGDGSSCLDCEGTPFGVLKVDQCGVCGGDGLSCLDCDGKPFGTSAVDSCGVCGGDNKSCMDCTGTINGTAIVDQCGVCGGDGTSCLECTSTNVSETQMTLDGFAVAQRHWNLYALKQLARYSRSKKTKKFIQKQKAMTEELYLKSWNLVWSIPSVQTQCENHVYCVNVDNTPVKDTYREHADTLHSILKRSARKLSSVAGRRKRRVRRLKVTGRGLWEQAIHGLDKIPGSRSVCTKVSPGIY